MTISKTIVYLIILLAINGCGRKVKTTEANNQIQNAIAINAELFLKDKRINSVSVGIVKEGKRYSGHYGDLDGNSTIPNDKTYYKLASVTKTMTGSLIAQAEIDKKLSIEDDIRLYLKGDYDNLAFKGEAIKIKHLLTHTSRLPSNPPGISELYNNKNDSTFIKVAELNNQFDKNHFFEFLTTVELDTFPGIKYQYSNVATELVGHILEVVYNDNYENILKRFIFNPASMEYTKIELTEEEKKTFTVGYNDFGTQMPLYNNVLWGSSGGVKSTTADMQKYMLFQMDSLNKMANNSHQLLFEKRSDYGMGYLWAVHTKEEGVYYQHNGTTSGFQNWVAIYPDYDLGVFVAMNTTLKGGLRNLRDIVHGLVNDLKPFGKKSISHAILPACYENMEDAISHYYALKESSKEQYDFENERALNLLGYRFINEGAYPKAIKIFTLMTKEFPTSANAYDSLGEAFMENKQYKEAIKNYTKSLELDPKNKNAEEMIQKIKADNKQ